MMSAQPLHITPPGSLKSLPLTPPATEEKRVSSILHIVEVVRRHKDGRSLNAEEHWLRFPLNACEYEILEPQLRKCNLLDHYRYELR
jgi:hypothetical protein